MAHLKLANNLIVQNMEHYGNEEHYENKIIFTKLTNHVERIL